MFIENIQSYKWIFMASFLSALTIIIIKYYNTNKHNLWLLVALLSEIGLVYSYIQLVKTDDVLTQFSLVKTLAILMVIIPSMLFFDSKLTVRKIIGLMFGIATIYLLK
jgi:multidrug transporter EmrE-like cation transporter